MPLTSMIKLVISSNLSGAGDLATPKHDHLISKTLNLANGTGADQANMIWSDQRTLAASATEDLDLAASLTDAFGASITFTRIKGIYVFAAAANTNNVEVGGAASNGFDTWVGAAGDHVEVRPGGIMFVYAPDATAYVVTAGTGDLLTITNAAGGTAVTYDIALIGTV